MHWFQIRVVTNYLACFTGIKSEYIYRSGISASVGRVSLDTISRHDVDRVSADTRYMAPMVSVDTLPADRCLKYTRCPVSTLFFFSFFFLRNPGKGTFRCFKKSKTFPGGQDQSRSLEVCALGARCFGPIWKSVTIYPCSAPGHYKELIWSAISFSF